MDPATLIAQGGLGITVAVLIVICRELWKALQRKDAEIMRIVPLMTEVNTNVVAMNESAGALVSTLAVVQDRDHRRQE